MFCGNCGNRLGDEDLFCAICGTSVKNNTGNNKTEDLLNNNQPTRTVQPIQQYQPTRPIQPSLLDYSRVSSLDEKALANGACSRVISSRNVERGCFVFTNKRFIYYKTLLFGSTKNEIAISFDDVSMIKDIEFKAELKCLYYNEVLQNYENLENDKANGFFVC